jgi:nucleoside-diphosphate-sugar epimerase
MNKKLFIFFAFVPFFVTTTPEQTVPKWVIVGGTRGAGYALANELCKTNDCSCTLIVRDDKKAQTLFANATNKPTIIAADVATDLATLTQTATGASYIVIAALLPYAVWADSFQAMIINCIAAAQETNATLIYYGRIQRYGLVNPITETSISAPNSDQGIILDAMEKLLEECATKTIIIHHSYPFGPNVGDGLLEKNFTEIPLNKNKSWYQSKQKFEWIGSKTVKLQFTYLPDLAKFTKIVAARVANQRNQESTDQQSLCTTINFAGLTVNSIDEFGSAYAAIANVPYELELFSSKMLALASTFRPEAKRAKDAFYSFTNELLLSADKQQALYPFELTPLTHALQETYDAYASA